METGTTVLCRLVDAEGTPLGDPMYIPRQAGPVQLTELANRFLNNVRFFFLWVFFQLFKIVLLCSWNLGIVYMFQEEKLNYAFYVSGEALSVPVGTYIENRSGNIICWLYCFSFIMGAYAI